MIYHAPSNSFTVKQEELRAAADRFYWALRQVRSGANLPMEPYHWESAALEWYDFAQIGICEAALKLGIDLGVNGDSHNYHKIDLRGEA